MLSNQNLQNVEMLLEGRNPMRQLKEMTRTIINRWEQVGLLDGVDNEYEKSATAILLENQARQILDESSRTGTTAGSEEWAGVALPLVRRIFAEIAAKDFVSVQPMNLPSGLVFYLDFKYGTSQPGFTVSSALSQTGTIHGVTNASGDPSGGLYGAGRFGYSINEQSSASLTAACTSASWAETNFSTTLSASVAGAASDIKKLVVTLGEDYDTTGVRAFVISGSTPGDVSVMYPALTKHLGSQQVQFIVSGSHATSSYTVYYHKAPTAVTRGDFEDTTGTGTSVSSLDIPELNLQMRSTPIVAKTRKLKAIWTPEFAQDLNAYHSIDAEAEVTSILSEYISMEIDLEILDMLISAALTEDYWAARIGYEYDSTLGIFSATDSSTNAASAFNKMTWFQTLGNKLQRVSNKIHQKTMRGGANFLVCSPDVATIIESIPGYAPDTDGNKMQFAMGVQKVGQLNNRFTVYKNPYMLENVILIGFRGTQFLETGAVYAPYIPLIMTPLVYDPISFTPRKGIMTRYAKMVTRPEFYGKVVVGYLDSI